MISDTFGIGENNSYLYEGSDIKIAFKALSSYALRKTAHMLRNTKAANLIYVKEREEMSSPPTAQMLFENILFS